MKNNRIWLSVGILFIVINLALAVYDYMQGFEVTVWGTKLGIAAFGLICVAGLVYAQCKMDTGIGALKAAGFSDDAIARLLKEKDIEAAVKRELEAMGRRDA